MIFGIVNPFRLRISIRWAVSVFTVTVISLATAVSFLPIVIFKLHGWYCATPVETVSTLAGNSLP
ncbi:hypothetical protein D3C73_1447140 [compost metagenome]